MAKVISIVDSDTGALVDVAGNSREGGRYRKFAKRMMSVGENPVVLDYGANGGTKLEISNGGYSGEEIVLKANTVKVSGDNLMVGGKTLEEIISASADASVLEDVVGGTGISVSLEPDQEDPEKTVLVISLSSEVSTALAQIGQALEEIDTGEFVRKDDLAGVIAGVDFDEDDTLDDVKGKLNYMLDQLSALVGT